MLYVALLHLLKLGPEIPLSEEKSMDTNKNSQKSASFNFIFFYMESLFYDSQQEPQRIDF